MFHQDFKYAEMKHNYVFEGSKGVVGRKCERGSSDLFLSSRSLSFERFSITGKGAAMPRKTRRLVYEFARHNNSLQPTSALTRRRG